MENPFSPEEFRATQLADLGRYVESIWQGETSKPSAKNIHVLLDEIDSLGELHATYVIIWAVEEGIPCLADSVVQLIRRCRDRGGQYTLTRILAEAKDLRQKHIDDVEAIAAQSPHFILRGGLDELKDAWCKRASLSREDS